MKKVGISADLEKRIRSGYFSAAQSPELSYILIKLLDDASAPPPPKVQGLGYKELVGLFRDNLGDSLALPPKPNTVWIVRQINKAREIGLDAESIGQLCRLARVRYPKGALELEFLLRIATRVLSEGEPGPGESAPGVVHTGRGAQDGE